MKPRVLVGIPSLGEWKAGFGTSLGIMMAYTMAKGGKEVALSSVVGSILPNQRLDIVRSAIRQEMTHVLFIDADMVFPAHLLDTWLKYGKEVVAANCAIKTIPSQPTARVWNNDRWKSIYTNPDCEGLERVDRIGTGIMLVDMRVFDRIEPPFFEMRWCEESGGFQGEDWHFCEKLEAAGVEMWIDHTVSKEVLHVGDFKYGHKHIRSELIRPTEVKDKRVIGGG